MRQQFYDDYAIRVSRETSKVITRLFQMEILQVFKPLSRSKRDPGRDWQEDAKLPKYFAERDHRTLI